MCPPLQITHIILPYEHSVLRTPTRIPMNYHKTPLEILTINPPLMAFSMSPNDIALFKKKARPKTGLAYHQLVLKNENPAGSAAITPLGRGLGLTHDVVVNPFGHKATRFVQGRFRMVNAVERCAGVKRGHIFCADFTQFLISRDDCAFAFPRDPTWFNRHGTILS